MINDNNPTTLISYISNHKYIDFLGNLPKPLNQNNIKKILDSIVNNLPEEDYFKLGEKLISIWSHKSKKIGFPLIGVYWRNNPNLMENYLIKLANDPDWGTREYAAKLWAVVLTEDFKKVYPWSMDLVHNGTYFTKRAIVLAAKYSVLERKPGKEKKLLLLLEPLLSNKNNYVRKNLGPFSLAAFLRAFPKLTIPELEKWSNTNNEQIKWNVAKAFASSGGTTVWPLGKDILSCLAIDERRYVWKAVSSALIYLGRKKPKEIIPLLKKWLLDPKRKHVAEDALNYI